MKKTVTLTDVAAVARVSKATVSNVFSRPDRVRPALRQRVEAAAESLGYDGPDPKGRLLSSGKVNAIGVVPPADGLSWVFASVYMRDFLTGVAQVCEEKGVGLSLVFGDERGGAWDIRTAVLDGFILNSVSEAASIERALRRKLPFVVMDAIGTPEINTVGPDERGSAWRLTRYLIELGHRRFAIVSCGRKAAAPVFHPPNGGSRRLVMAFEADEQRILGVADALGEAGLSIDDFPIFETCGIVPVLGDDQERRLFGHGGAELVLDNAGDATAIIAMPSELAIAAVVEARRRGIDVPGKLSIATMDDAPEVSQTDPPLTAISVSSIEKGRTAARLLFEDGPPRQVVLPADLVIRASTGPPRH